ncbi:MAG: recombinase zinc beta ribbon domain-containing protein [Ignavibacteria bacterium]|nr:recombinase zinc beta ribbon domain-containing protein [Ignavibacteria bacterium]
MYINRHPFRKQKYSWAFQGFVRCGSCGCVLSAEKHKGRYVYYRCTNAKGGCDAGEYVRRNGWSRHSARSSAGFV